MLLFTHVVVRTVLKILEGYKCHSFLHFSDIVWFAFRQRYELFLGQLNALCDLLLLNQPDNFEQF